MNNNVELSLDQCYFSITAIFLVSLAIFIRFCLLIISIGL